MNFRTTLLTALLVIGISFQSCFDETCDCCFTGEYKAFFDIQDLDVKHWDTNFNPIEGNEIRFEDYGFINLHFIVEYIVQEQKKNHFSFSLMNTAYACSPVPPGEEGSKEEAIESLKITTLNDFDEDHKTGDSINDLLELNDIVFGNDPILLEDFLDNMTGNVPSEYLMLRLLKEPTESQDFQVQVTIELSTGENYEATTELIRFI